MMVPILNASIMSIIVLMAFSMMDQDKIVFLQQNYVSLTSLMMDLDQTV